jgi:hypothetical protein
MDAALANFRRHQPIYGKRLLDYGIEPGRQWARPQTPAKAKPYPDHTG